MKKAILVLSAIGGMVYLTSCGGEQPVQNAETNYTQAQLDSIMKVQQDSIAAAQALANDSLLNKMAADSIAAAEAATAAAAANAANAKPVSGKTNTKPVTKPSTSKPTTPTEKQPTEVVKEAPRTQEQIKSDKKKAEFGDAGAKARLEQDKANKKKAEFGDQNAQQKLDETKASKKAAEFNR